MDLEPTDASGGPDPGLATSASICNKSSITIGSMDVPLLPQAPSTIELADPCQEPERVDWDSLKIVETQHEEGRVEVMTDDNLYVLLGLRDEDERNKQAAQEATRKRRSKKDKEQPTTDDTDGAAILVSDHIADEVFISYDKDHPTMKIGTLYPSMDEFRLAVRQYAINEEFELGTQKSCKTKFRGFCKGDDCDWSIVGTRLNDNKTIKITCILD